MIDSHVHSSFSGDCETPAREACEKAIDIGLDGIAFTDHLDYDYPDYDDKFLIDFDRYSHGMDRLKTDYRGKLKVFKGIEVGIQPHVLDESSNLIRKYNFDFVICSVHIIDRQDPYTGQYYIGKTKDEAFRRYLEAILFTTQSFNDYDVIGHIGYIRRYGNYDDRSLRHADYSDLLDSILNNVIEKGKGLEVNTSGYRTGLESPMPDYDIIKRYLELGGEIITLGSDAHTAGQIALKFTDTVEVLKKIGVKHIAYFEDRKPAFYSI